MNPLDLVEPDRPEFTPSFAAMIGIVGRYAWFDYRLALLEIHKLVYFRKIAGGRWSCGRERNVRVNGDQHFPAGRRSSPSREPAAFAFARP